MGKPKLKFGETSDSQGFVAGELGISDDRYPPGIIREIVQNSLDAAVFENDAEKASIRFYIDKIKKNDIPGILEYEEALSNIKKGYELSSKKMNPKEQGIVNSIEKTLKAKEVDTLMVVDNGVGLNTTRMNSILSNGSSQKKDDNTSGSRGNGHFATFSLSNLRYLIYGGVSKDNGHIFSGHAILASQSSNKKSANGRYIIKESPDLLGDYEFCSPNQIPSFMKKKLSEIESDFGTGTTLGVLGFSRFNVKQDKKISRIILSSISRNFFVAISEGMLEVKIYNRNSSIGNLNAKTLRSFLSCLDDYGKNKERFPSKALSERFYETLDSPEKTIGVHTSKNEKESKCKAYIKFEDVRRTEIVFFRNGMWITKQIPRIDKSDFRDHKSFRMLITCDKEAGNFHKLVRQSENNLHTEINPDSIVESTSHKKLVNSLDYIKEQIAENIPRQPQGEEYDASFTIDIPGHTEDFEKMPDRSSSRFYGGDSSNNSEGRRTGIGGGGGSNPKRRKRIKITKSIVVPVKVNKIQIEFIPGEDCDKVGLSLEVQNGKDATCDKPDPNTAIGISKVVRDGKKILSDGKQLNNNPPIIGSIKKGTTINLEIEYKVDENIKDIKTKSGFNYSVECVLEKIKD